MKKIKQKKIIQKESEFEKERQMIIAKADERKGEQLVINEDGLKTIQEIKMFAFGSIEDPEKKYDIYYKGIQRLMKKHLPKGKKNQKARSYIYEEKNTFLTRGKRINKIGIRGADGRMGYISDAEEVLNILAKWVLSKGTMWELFTIFREINKKKGYGVRVDF